MRLEYRWLRLLDRPVARSRIVRVLWIMVAAAVAVRLSVMLSRPVLPGQHFPGLVTDRYFIDFRDTIWTPGRFLLDGGNPYDPDTYLAANPWALLFSPYTPAWLLLAVAIAPLPYLASIVVYQALALVLAIIMLRVICRWALPSLIDVAVPVALLWLNIWYPGRGALSVQLSTLLVVLGIALVLRSLTAAGAPASGPAAPGRSRAGTVDRWCAVGVALALVKAQFGIAALVALAGGRWREVWRGIAGLILVSMPVLVACIVAAGGPVEFARSMMRNLEVANSAGNLAGLTSPDQRRLDLLGQLARYGLDHPPTWLQVAVLVLTLVAGTVVIRLTRNPLLVSAVVCPSVLIGIYHGTYDLLLLLVPVALGIGMALRREIATVAEWVALGALLLVVLHLHTVTTSLVPGLDMRAADTVNLVLLLTGLAAGLFGAVAGWRKAPAADDEPYVAARADQPPAAGPAWRPDSSAAATTRFSR